MRYAVLGDIHGNVEALNAVLLELKDRPVDRYLHTGDIVGYCTDSLLVIDILVANNMEGVLGNHECMAMDRIDIKRTSKNVRKAIEWTKSRLI